MVSRVCTTNSFGILVVAVSLIVSVGCDRPFSDATDIGTFATPLSVSPFVTTSIVPQQVGLAPALGVVCVGFPAVTTRFDFVIVNGPNDLFIQQIGFRLLDVSQIGGSPLVVSASDISARFGSPLVRGSSQRSFTFDPQFGCGTFAPAFLSAELLFTDTEGGKHTKKIMVPTKPMK
jgi:hypothetical protein